MQNIQTQTTDNQVTEAYRTAAVTKGSVDGRVSAQWASRPDDQKFTNLDDLYDSVHSRAMRCNSELVGVEDLRVVADNDTVQIENFRDANRRALDLTNYAFGQLCGFAKTPAEYLRRLPAKLAGINLQYGLANYQGDALNAFAYENGSSELRSINSKHYGRIFDHEVVDAVRKIAGNGTGDTRWKVPGMIDWTSRSDNGTVLYNPFVDITKENTTLYASDRDVYLFLVDDTHPIEVGKLPDGSPDLMFRGFVVWNSEVGAKSFGLTCFMLRGVCQNRNLWGVEGTKELRIRHTSNAPDRFALEAGVTLENYANASTAGIVAKVQNAKALIVARNDEERVDFLTAKVGLSKPLTDRVIETVLNEEQKPAESIWDFVQGITAVARKVKHQDARLDLEAKGSKLMDKVEA